MSRREEDFRGATVLFYDGVCGLCNRSVRFILKRDRADRFRFASLQSAFAREALGRRGLDPGKLDTMYLVEGLGESSERVSSRARAGLRAIELLGGVWKAAKLLRVLPHPLLDFFYRIVARARYRLFGKHQSCPIPPAGARHKFIEV